MRNPLPVSLRRAVPILAVVAVHTLSASAQTTPTTYAQGLTAPIGLAIDGDGRLWVAQQGTANNDSRISVVTTDGQVHPFLDGLPSETNAQGEVSGANHVYFDGTGNLMIVQGEGTGTLSAAVLLVDTTGWVPGNSALDGTAVHTTYDIGAYSLDQGFAETNPFALAIGPNNDIFVADAAANAIIKRDGASGDFSVLTTFDDVANGTGIGPPTVDAVPTGPVIKDGKVFVGSLTGFPFGNGAASVYEVTFGGTTSVFMDGLTTVVDVDIDPRDGEIVVLQHAAFSPPPPFAPSSGGVFKLRGDGTIDTMATGLNRPSGMRFAPSGDLFISTLTDGLILKVEATPTGLESLASLDDIVTSTHAYPNPFRSTSRIRYVLSASVPIVVTISDVLGREVRRVHEGTDTAGSHEVIWDGKNDAGSPVAPGVYLFSIKSPGRSVSGSIVLVE